MPPVKSKHLLWVLGLLPAYFVWEFADFVGYYVMEPNYFGMLNLKTLAFAAGIKFLQITTSFLPLIPVLYPKKGDASRLTQICALTLILTLFVLPVVYCSLTFDLPLHLQPHFQEFMVLGGCLSCLLVFYLVLLFHEKASILACGRWIPTILAVHAVGWLLFLASLIFLMIP